ncbi:ROK family transcriptional regulator [Streptomyces avicenniae]|uniref:ROK family transcriptional regulator n=1 Tax=Streptomyces avicenniae TaxID=500153 RepID=UPI0006998929|nr:ROK family transcriptional regulator [Streptomyces avicenniae]
MTARTATPRTARAINDRIALDLLAVEGPLTATRLRELTGLSRPSVSDLLGRLGDDGLVRIVGEAGEERRGPKARLYGLAADRAHVAAFDVRTDSVAFALADLTGRTLAHHTLPVPQDADDPDRSTLIGTVLAALDTTLGNLGVPAVHTAVLGAPGLADPATGALRPFSSLPGWHGALLTELRARLDAPVHLENEVNLAGIAEHRVGAARDRDTFALLWLGHGLGAALVLRGALWRGATGGAGEVGFLPVPGTGGMPSSLDCDAGFHALAAAPVVRALAREHGLTAPGDDVTAAETLIRAAAGAPAGEPGAALLDALAGRVVIGIAGLVSVLDPGCVVLGGEIGRAGGDALAARVSRLLRDLSPLDTEIRPATVTGSPVLGGGLVTALDAARDDLFGPAVGR